jgi:triacylglycerol esterase/lipase EstA (alpha/beta hydrolase family)
MTLHCAVKRAIISAIILLLTPVLGSAQLGSRYTKQSQGNQSVIVFVHGIFGDSVSTWTNRNGAYWPDLLGSDPFFSRYDVYTYEYASRLVGTFFSIDEIAENMRLTLDADLVSDHKEIIFVSHSMGGLVTRAYLNKNRAAADRVRLAYFYSTPTTGSELASIASLVSRNPQLAQMRPMQSAEYLGDLQRQWLDINFQIPSFCAYEKQSTYGVNVVTQASASNLCNRRLDPIDADHITIVKPADTRDTPYLALKSAIQQTPPKVSADSETGVIHPVEKNFEHVDTWSVSFTIGGPISARSPINSYLMIYRCDFANLSATQKRVLDFQLQILTENNHHPDLVLNTANIEFQPEKWSEADMGRPNATLANPLVLEPNAFAEGIVEFAMNADQAIKYKEILDHHLVTKMYENSVFYVIDRRSGTTMKTKLGEHYDARTGDVWRAGCLPALPPGENGGC